MAPHFITPCSSYFNFFSFSLSIFSLCLALVLFLCFFSLFPSFLFSSSLPFDFSPQSPLPSSPHPLARPQLEWTGGGSKLFIKTPRGRPGMRLGLSVNTRRLTHLAGAASPQSCYVWDSNSPLYKSSKSEGRVCVAERFSSSLLSPRLKRSRGMRLTWLADSYLNVATPWLRFTSV